MSSPEQMVNVRYMVDDVQAAIGFQAGHLGFTPRSSAAPTFADVTRGNLRLLLAGPGGKQILIEDPAGNVVELFEPASSSPGRP